VKSLRKTNAELKEKINSFYSSYQSLEERIKTLSEKSHDLRLATNLEPLENNDTYGTGGSAFTPIKSNNPSEIESKLEELDTYINRVSLKVKLETNNYQEIENKLSENEKLFSIIPAIIPCTGRVADDFGLRLHPILKIRRMHNGIDIITDIGTKIFAPGGGRIAFAGRRGGFGLTLEIDHGFGYRTIFAHLERINVKEGQLVQRGDLIANSGNSGSLSTGPHLHYEIRHNDIPLNPKNFIYDDVELFEIVKK
jgi:murein DD-endopeptidase MepM/ murein hydrolase activator NlpD